MRRSGLRGSGAWGRRIEGCAPPVPAYNPAVMLREILRFDTPTARLRAVAYMTPEIYSALYPLVSAWPQDPKPLNIHTAAPALLRSINLDGELEPLSEIDGERLAEYRNDAGFADLEDFFVQASLDEASVAELRPLLGETTSWFLLGATVEVAERQMRLYSVLQRRGRSIQAVVRASGSL